MQKIKITDIIRDQDTLQARNEIDPKTVESYARSMKAGSKFPAVSVFKVDDKYFLVDGFHRVEAAEAVAVDQMKVDPVIEAEVTEGVIGEAIAAAAVANTTNGKQMKKKEYRNSFRMLGESGTLKGMDSRSIADRMNHVVSHVTIWKWANEDFPGLLSAKPKKGQKKDLSHESYYDVLSTRDIEQRAAVTGITTTYRLLSAGSVKDKQALDDIAELAREILDQTTVLGGDPDAEIY